MSSTVSLRTYTPVHSPQVQPSAVNAGVLVVFSRDPGGEPPQVAHPVQRELIAYAFQQALIHYIVQLLMHGIRELLRSDEPMQFRHAAPPADFAAPRKETESAKAETPRGEEPTRPEPAETKRAPTQAEMKAAAEKTLGLKPGYTPADAKKAYYAKARENHPNQGVDLRSEQTDNRKKEASAEEVEKAQAFQEIKEAYDFLKSLDQAS